MVDGINACAVIIGIVISSLNILNMEVKPNKVSLMSYYKQFHGLATESCSTK